MAHRGYVAIYRGLLDHFTRLSDGAICCYLAMHILADYDTGEVRFWTADLAQEMGKSTKTLRRYFDELEAKGYITRLAHDSHTERAYAIDKYKSAAAHKARKVLAKRDREQLIREHERADQERQETERPALSKDTETLIHRAKEMLRMGTDTGTKMSQ